MSSMLEYKGYHATIEFDAEDDIFVGEVFGITDSLNFHGTSIEELKQMFHQSIDNYLEVCRKIGKEPDKEFKGSFNVRIPPDLHKKIALGAAKQKITLNQYVIKALSAYTDKINMSTKETVIYIPYDIKQVEWETDASMLPLYHDGKELSWKEDISYVGN